MSKRSLRGEVAENYTVNRQGFDKALEDWKGAKEKDKPRCAFFVLSHVGAMQKKLRDLIEDGEMVKAIITDNARHK